jgi:hypothetical protein
MNFDNVETYSSKDTQIKFNTIQPKWAFDIFGDRQITFHLPHQIPWHKRAILTFFLGSKWTRIKK